MYRICWIVEKYPARSMVLLSKYIWFRPHKFKVNPLNGDDIAGRNHILPPLGIENTLIMQS
jgi:hypothetical protein